MQDYEYLMGVTDEEFLNELNSALTRPPQMLLPKVFQENLENVLENLKQKEKMENLYKRPAKTKKKV